VFAEELFESTFLEDPRSVSAWDRYRKGILEIGGSRDELKLLVEYLGHIPTADPLLRDILQ
jgi:metallopeptidase MepB